MKKFFIFICCVLMISQAQAMDAKGIEANEATIPLVPEIWFHVFNSLPKRDLLYLGLVAKPLRRLAIEMGLPTLLVDEDNFNLQELINYLEEADSSPEPFPFRSLHCKTRTKLWFNNFSEKFFLIPALKYLDTLCLEWPETKFPDPWFPSIDSYLDAEVENLFPTSLKSLLGSSPSCPVLIRTREESPTNLTMKLSGGQPISLELQGRLVFLPTLLPYLGESNYINLDLWLTDRGLLTRQLTKIDAKWVANVKKLKLHFAIYLNDVIRAEICSELLTKLSSLKECDASNSGSCFSEKDSLNVMNHPCLKRIYIDEDIYTKEETNDRIESSNHNPSHRGLDFLAAYLSKCPYFSQQKNTEH